MILAESIGTIQKGRVLLIRLNYLVLIATTLYALLDQFLGIYVAYYVYLGFYLFVLINALLIRYNKLEISKAFGLTSFNIMIFIISTSEPFSTGMHLQYVTSGAVALSFYGYRQWKNALFFVGMALVLDIITFTAGTPLIPWRHVEVEQARVFFVLNTLIAASISIYVFMIASKVNFESEKSLIENEKTIKEQNERLKKANRELDRFVYSASHDLRAPLSTLTGLLNLSRMESDPVLKMEYLEMMHNRIKAMHEFIDEIIDYSRNTRLEVAKENVNIKGLLQTVTEELKYSEGRNHLSIYWEVDEHISVRSDLVRLKIVFTNLISNAIKYSDPNKVERWIKLRAKSSDHYAEITVEDNGIGIDESLKNQVFNMFFRAHDHSAGSGLGLYIVRETLSKLSGSIAVSSAIGKGSEFTVYLPLAQV